MAGRVAAPTPFDWATLRDNVQKEVDRLNGVYIRLLEGAGVKLHMGRGRLMDRHTIEVGERDGHGREDPDRHRRPARGAAIPRQRVRHHLQRGVPSARPLPKRITIVGGGYIAVEFAGIFNGLGCAGRPGDPPRPRAARLRRGVPHRRARGAEGKRHQHAHRDARSQRIEATDGKAPFAVHTPLGGMFETDVVMYATGRVPNTAGIGLEKVGVQLDKAGAIAVDEWSKTTAPNI